MGQPARIGCGDGLVREQQGHQPVEFVEAVAGRSQGFLAPDMQQRALRSGAEETADQHGIEFMARKAGHRRAPRPAPMWRKGDGAGRKRRGTAGFARQLEDDCGVPFFEGSFYGITDTSQAFRDFARLFGDADLTRRTEAMIVHEEAWIDAALAPWAERLKGRRVLLYTGGVKSWSVVSALQDLGMTVVATGTKKSTEEDKARIREIMGADARSAGVGQGAGAGPVGNAEGSGRSLGGLRFAPAGFALRNSRAGPFSYPSSSAMVTVAALFDRLDPHGPSSLPRNPHPATRHEQHHPSGG